MAAVTICSDFGTQESKELKSLLMKTVKEEIEKVGLKLNFSIGLSNEYSGLISFKINWLDLIAIQGTLKHLLQHHS